MLFDKLIVCLIDFFTTLVVVITFYNLNHVLR